ncbi:MAG: Uma2 family endonuclease [Candidatus Riflebacteria bacterium]|nr:Uma2 family endonuclease [Candidatus Riflebacteria bacterium]
MEQKTRHVESPRAAYAAGKEVRNDYTYGDYLNWPDEERYEIIDGEVFDMTPAPLTVHQRILLNLALPFGNYLKGKPCKLFIAPFDIRLPKADEPDKDVRTVVQPDLVVICEKIKIDRRGCRGAPDLAIEILSPSTASKDSIRKLALYESHGVKEYWIINPETETLTVFWLSEKGKYSPGKKYSKNESISPHIFPELKIQISEIFEE